MQRRGSRVFLLSSRIEVFFFWGGGGGTTACSVCMIDSMDTET